MNFKINPSFITILTIFVSVIFIGKAFHNLLNYGSDFQTSYILGKSFWDGINVFTLENKNPYYPHIWYVALFPFIHLKFEVIRIIFFILNLFFFFGSILILKKNFNLNSFETKILIILSVASTPFTNLMALGNLSLMALYFILIYYFYTQILLRGIALSLAFVKYNISFFFLILPFLQREKKLAIIFILINLGAVLFYHYYLDIHDPLKIFDPLLAVINTVNQQIDNGEVGINLGLFNLNNLMIDLKISRFYYPVFVIILLMFSYYLVFRKSISRNKLLVIIFMVTSAIIYHAIYDFVILIPVLAYLIKNRLSLKYSVIYFFSIINIFYLYKVNTIFNNVISKEIYSTFGMILLVLSIILLIFFEKE